MSTYYMPGTVHLVFASDLRAPEGKQTGGTAVGLPDGEIEIWRRFRAPVQGGAGCVLHNQRWGMAIVFPFSS